MAGPHLATVAIIKKGEKILFVKRAQDPEAGKWALPFGLGAFEKHFDPEEAVKCEVEYDLGVDYSIDYFFNYYYRESEGEAFVSLVFSGKIKGEIKPNPGSVKEMRFFSEEEIAKSEFAFEHKKIIEEYLYQ